MDKYITRLVFLTSHKDIATLYIISGIFSGMIGTVLSMLIRSELTRPGAMFGDDHLYNVIVTTNAFIMIISLSLFT